MADRTCHWDGDGARLKEHYEQGPAKRPRGLAAARTGQRLAGIDLEVESNRLREWLSAGRWLLAMRYCATRVDSPGEFDLKQFLEEFHATTPTPPCCLPSPVHLAIIEERLRIHMIHGEWLVMTTLLLQERAQALDDAQNGPPDDKVVRVHRTHPHNYGKRKTRKS